MSRIVSESDDWQPHSLPKQLKKPNIPRAFIKNDDSRWVLCDVISDFHYEEKQAIYYCCVLDTTVEDVAQRVELSPNHVASVLVLYSERLELKLFFFKKIMSYDESDLISVSEILFLESAG